MYFQVQRYFCGQQLSRHMADLLVFLSLRVCVVLLTCLKKPGSLPSWKAVYSPFLGRYHLLKSNMSDQEVLLCLWSAYFNYRNVWVHLCCGRRWDFNPVESLRNISLCCIPCSFICNFTSEHSGWFCILLCEYWRREHASARTMLRHTLDEYPVLELLSLNSIYF